ncbi:MAG: hypothetical protein ABIH42_05460 [Planctomycetota bacterium]
MNNKHSHERRRNDRRHPSSRGTTWTGTERRSGRDRRQISDQQHEDMRAAEAARKKQNQLIMIGIGGAILFIFIIAVLASNNSSEPESSSYKKHNINLEEKDGEISRLTQSAGDDMREAQMLASSDRQSEADRYFQSAYDKLSRALEVAKQLAELYPNSKYPIQERNLSHELREIESKIGFGMRGG